MSTPEPRRRSFPPSPRRMQAAPLLVHFVKALTLRPDFYALVAADPNTTRPAVAVVCLAALAHGGTLMPISPTIEDLARALGYWILPLLMFLGVARWAVYGVILWFTGAVLLRQRPAFKRVLRCLGFAQAPALLSLIVLLDPAAEPWLRRVIQLWLLASTVVATRAAFATTLGRAALVGVLAYAIDYLLPLLAAFLLLKAIHGS